MKTKEQLQAIRQDIDNALAEVAKKHGIEVCKLGKIRHDNDGFTSSLEVQYVGGDSVDMKALKMNAPYIGFKQAIAGSTIKYGGKDCKVIGMKRTKLMLEIAGKNYTANIEDVKRVLQSQKSEFVV